MGEPKLNVEGALSLIGRILDRQVVVERRRVQVQSAFLKEVIAAVKSTKRKKRRRGVRK